MSQDWRIEINSVDYLGHQQKRLVTEERRAVIRKASDLVGPGIDASAVRLTDYNDLLATFNGYFSSLPGALYAPNSEDSFIGSVINDADLGGQQRFTSLVSGNEYIRVFRRNPSDAASISWGNWHTDEAVPATVYSPASGTQSDTHMDNDIATTCTMPGMVFAGDPDTYARSSMVLSILRPGSYSGYLWIRTLEDTLFSSLTVEFPNAAGQAFDTIFNHPSGQGVQWPLHFYTTATTGFIRVTATLFSDTLGDGTVQFQRLHLTRIGDA